MRAGAYRRAAFIHHVLKAADLSGDLLTGEGAGPERNNALVALSRPLRAFVANDGHGSSVPSLLGERHPKRDAKAYS